VLAGFEKFLEKRLKLKINKAKSAVAQPSVRKFLGFSFTGRTAPRRRYGRRGSQAVSPRSATHPHGIDHLDRLRHGGGIFPAVLHGLETKSSSVYMRVLRRFVWRLGREPINFRLVGGRVISRVA
jgi:hypothetical protein